MNGWIELPNLVMSSSALLMMLLGLFVTVIIPGVDRWSKRFFITFFAIIALCNATYLADMTFCMAPGRMLAERIAVFLESILAALLMPLLTVYLQHSCGEQWRGSALFRTVIGLMLVYLALLIVTQFTTFIYYVTPDNEYYRGPWYPLLLLPPFTIMCVNLLALSRRQNRLSRKYYWAFFIYLIVPAISMLVQMLCYGLLFIGFGMTLGALTMFGIILTDQIEQYLRQEEQIAQQRASIMVLQMRPHFIYNTMTSIYYLCAQDPKKAQQVTLDFTAYLRKNFTAIAAHEAIPFTEELEHTRAYLAVEQAQFEDKLFVEYDTSHVHFRVPPLTLQPIVENAVKHGMDPDLQPLRITITTRQTPAGSEIIVADNGPGFESTDDSAPHLALENIRERLVMMCGGTLEITPNETGGTSVRLVIP